MSTVTRVRPSTAETTWRRFTRHRMAVAGAIWILLLVIVAILGGAITPSDAGQQDLRNVLAPMTLDHPFGTDELGRDVLSRLMVSTRLSLIAALQAVGIAFLLGLVPGFVAGYTRGWIDVVVMRITDALVCLPSLILALAIVGVLGPSLSNAMVALGVVFTPRVIRLTRATVMAIKEETFIDASRVIGTSGWRIVMRHVVPNVRSALLVQASLMLGLAMLAEASLSFIGLGAQPPQSSWGLMLGRAYRHIDRAPMLILVPGAAIAMAVLAFNLVSDGIRGSLGRPR